MGTGPGSSTPDSAGGGTHDTGGPRPAEAGGQSGTFTSYAPAGCDYTVAPASTLGYTNVAYDDTSVNDAGSNAAPARVRLGLGGNTTAGQPGYADPTTTAVFTWETSAQTNAAKVKFGTSSTALHTVQAGYVWTLPATASNTPTYYHEVHVCGLTPATTYYYEVGGGPSATEVWSATQSFTTLPATGSIKVAIGGDARDVATTWQLANEHIKALNVDAFVFTGDLTLLGGVESETTQWLNEIWQNPSQPGQFITLGQLLFLPVAGNHEFEPVACSGPCSGPTYPQWLAAFAMPGTGAYAKSYGSYNIGNAHFVYIDDNYLANLPTGESSPQVTAQLAWLNTDLAAANSDRTAHPFIFVYSHRGLFSTSEHAADTDVLQARTTLAPIYAQYKVDAVFNGHDHEYERTVPIVPSSPVTSAPTPTTGGTTYVICAGVGANAYDVGAGTVSWRAKNVPFLTAAQAVDATVYLGIYMVATLEGTTATFDVYGLTGAGNDPVVDTFTLSH
jgi:acid phosphatase type 7